MPTKATEAQMNMEVVAARRARLLGEWWLREGSDRRGDIREGVIVSGGTQTKVSTTHNSTESEMKKSAVCTPTACQQAVFTDTRSITHHTAPSARPR